MLTALGAKLLAVHNWIDAKTKFLEGKRTYIVAGILATIDFLQVTDIAPILPPAVIPYWVVFHPLAMTYLRLITARVRKPE